MKKRLFALLLTAALLFTLLPQTVLFASAGTNSGTCGENLEWSFDEATGTLTITGSGSMNDWIFGFEAPWFSYCSSIKSVSLPDGLTSIGDAAFEGCTGLTAIAIPDSVTSIGDRAFSGCTGLTSITVAEGNPVYDSRNNCNAIIETATNTLIAGCKNTVIPSGVTSIGDWAFKDCTGLTAITIPDSVTSIGEGAFGYCTGLTAITIPDSVTSIGYYAFKDCTGLTDVYYPGTEEEWNAIDIDGENDPLANATIHFWPKGGTCGENLEWSFDEATGTLTITGSGSMNDWTWGSEAPWYSYCSSIKSVSLPDGLTSIGYYAFKDCTGLTAITIPDSVTSIGEYAFYHCTGLTAIAIPDSVTSIGDSAFADCTGLTVISIPDSVTSIGDSAFADCTGLTAISIPDSVTSIGDWAFGYCSGLTSVTIGNGVTSIGEYAFYCSSIKSVSLPDGLTSIGDAAFADCTGLTAISIPDSVTSIGWGAFYGCTGLTAIAIPDSVTSIGEQAFNGCTGLTSITVAEGNPVYDSRNNCNAIIETATNTLIAGCKNTVIPSGVTAISDGAFADCTGLTAISIPDSVTSIGWGAFYGCTGLTAITIGNGVTSIDYYAFYDCTGLTSFTVAEGNPVYDSRNNCNAIIETATNTLIAGCKNTVIPDSVTSIGDCAFVHCTGLTNITIPDSVTSICDEAFYGCTGLTAITIPDSVTSIGEWAFKDCTGLTDVYYPGTEEEWNAIDIDGENDPLANATIHFGQTEVDPCEGYTDINRGSWYHSAADFVIERGYMGSTKTDALTFEPNTKVSRAMVASILYRICGSPAVEYSGKFTDVKEGSWYTKAIEWCAQNGLASGYTDGTFKPNATVSRQELAVFMYKLAEHLGRDVSGRADLSGFADSASVPAWSEKFLQWAVSAGIISGQANGGKNYLKPADGAKRCEFASILMRFV